MAEHVRVRAPIDGTKYEDGLTAKKGEIYDAVVFSRSGRVMAVSIPSLDIQYALTNEGDPKSINCAHLKDKSLWELINE